MYPPIPNTLNFQTTIAHPINSGVTNQTLTNLPTNIETITSTAGSVTQILDGNPINKLLAQPEEKPINTAELMHAIFDLDEKKVNEIIATKNSINLDLKDIEELVFF